MRNEKPDPRVLRERSESNGLDALIDEAARRLVAGEPSSALRRDVRSRIDQRRQTWSLVPVWGAVAAALIAVVFMTPMFQRPSERPESLVATDRSNGKSGRDLATPAEPAAIQPDQRDARQLSRRRATTEPWPLPEEEPVIPPITIEPLVTVPLNAVPIAVDESSGPVPIDIEPLQIEPLLGQ